jgi:RHH-type proline utilization regulon transcriptional repressor/proline dehydrogenase/delta 1-pyrroline-5-carboxylate dehydrogenase
VQDWTRAEAHFDVVLLHGGAAQRLQVAAQLAQRSGPIVPLQAFDPGEIVIPLERLVVERSVSINTAAAGGNASLMAIG